MNMKATSTTMTKDLNAAVRLHQSILRNPAWREPFIYCQQSGTTTGPGAKVTYEKITASIFKI